MTSIFLLGMPVRKVTWTLQFSECSYLECRDVRDDDNLVGTRQGHHANLFKQAPFCRIRKRVFVN